MTDKLIIPDTKINYTNVAKYKPSIEDNLISFFMNLKYSLTEPLKLKFLRSIYAKKYLNKKNEPLVSIYVPTRNRSKILIDRALTTVLAQNYKNFEFIIVGDCCTDDTKAMVKKVNDKRIKFYDLQYKKKNLNNKEILWMGGECIAANFALSKCSGDWISRIDDDVYWTKDHIEKSLKFSLDNNIELCSSIHEVFEDGKQYIKLGPESYSDYFGTAKLKRKIKFKNSRMGSHPSWFYRSYLRFFKFNNVAWRKKWNRGGDVDLFERFVKLGVEIGYMEEVTGYTKPRPGEKYIGSRAVKEHGYLGVK